MNLDNGVTTFQDLSPVTILFLKDLFMITQMTFKVCSIN